MNYNDYEIKYMVRYDEQFCNYGWNSGAFWIYITPVFKLFELEGEVLQYLVIEVDHWSKIALIPICKSNYYTLVTNGAKIVDKQHVYDTEIDAKIQMAYVCSKYMIEPDSVYEVTGGLLTPNSYKQLLRIFYDDFPEKYV